MEREYIGILDYAVLPFILMIVYGAAYYYRNKYYPTAHPFRRYFIPALSVKIIGAIFIGLIYGYYYKGGDTFNYFYHSKVINSALDESLIKWLNLVLHIPNSNDIEYYTYTSQMYWYDSTSSSYVASIGAILGLLSLNTFLSTSVLFACLSFTGCWAMFRTFSGLYPKLQRQIAISILFIPSVFIWGSGIFKDTICLFGLGWLTYGSFKILTKLDFRISNILLTTLSFIFIFQVKVYILIGFLPALIMWIQFNYSSKIKSIALKIAVNIFLTTILILGSIFFMSRFSEELGRYSLEKIVQTSNSTKNYIYRISDEDASGYSLGDFNPTVGGMLSKFPQAVNVTLFRPYLWETKKLLVFLSSIEALLFSLLTLKILFTIKLSSIWKSIRKDPTIQFCLIFSIAFAFAVGISTYNFGALSRYKIPCLPFYMLALCLIYYQNAKPGQKLFGKVF